MPSGSSSAAQLLCCCTCWLLLLLHRSAAADPSVTNWWKAVGEWQPAADGNFTFYYRGFGSVVVSRYPSYAAEARSLCSQASSELASTRHLVSPLFLRLIFGNATFSAVTFGRSYSGFGEKRVTEPGRFFVDAGDGRVLLTELTGNGSSGSLRLVPPTADTDLLERIKLLPNFVLCVRTVRPEPTKPPSPPPLSTTLASTRRSEPRPPCDCPQASALPSDIAWPLACVAFLCVVSLCLAAALLLVCRRRQQKPPPAGDSIPRTSSSLMDFHEKAQAVASQTLPRRPRVIHHGQVHANGYLTLGSIQARKQREMQKQLGMSEPPSPNRSIARSDCRH